MKNQANPVFEFIPENRLPLGDQILLFDFQQAESFINNVPMRIAISASPLFGKIHCRQ
jgi:hypothetical protein